MRALELEYVVDGTTDKHQFLPEIRQNYYQTFKMMHHVYGRYRYTTSQQL